MIPLREVPCRSMHQAHQCGAGGSAGLAGQARAVLDVGDAW